MRKFTIVTYAVMLNILFLSNVVLNSESDADMPEWEVGYTWNYQSTGLVPHTVLNLTYKVIDTTNINVNGMDYEVYIVNSTSSLNSSGSKLIEYRDKYISKKDLSIIKIDVTSIDPLGNLMISESVFNPPRMDFNFPLYFGKNWIISYNETNKIVDEKDINLSITSNYTVVGEETLTVPAGSFECYKIEIKTGPWSTKYMWYSSKVRNIVKHTGEVDEIPFEIELNSYSLEAKEMDDKDSNPLSSSNYLLPIIIIMIIIVVLIAAILIVKKRKMKKKKKKKGKSKRKSKKKKK